jgi:hypothetical protein
MGFSTPSPGISPVSLPAHTSLRSVLPSVQQAFNGVQHPLTGHKPGEPPRSETRFARLEASPGSQPWSLPA